MRHALLVVAFLCACGGERVVVRPAPTEDTARLERELEETRRKLDLQSRYTADATATLNELQDHLAKIATLEGEIRGSSESGEPMTKSRREKMLAAVEQMQAGVAQQEQLLAGFRAREGQYTERVAELGAAIARFETVVATKNQEIARLRGEIEAVREEVQALRTDREEKQREIAEKQAAIEREQERVRALEAEARAARYIVAPMRTLLRENIITERRFFLSRVRKVSPSLDPAKLARIDIVEMRTMTIVAPRNRIEVISPHPPDSYSIASHSSAECVLTIDDPARFWTTRVLVVGIR